MYKKAKIKLNLLILFALFSFVLLQTKKINFYKKNKNHPAGTNPGMVGGGGGGITFLKQITGVKESLSKEIAFKFLENKTQAFHLKITNNSLYSVAYDLKILEKFNQTNNKYLKVIIRLRDDSSINLVGTKEEKAELMRQRDEWFKPKIDDVLSTLSGGEFILVRKLSNGFGGSITREGFDKLIDNLAVSEITLDIGGSIASENNNLSKNVSLITEIERDSENVIITNINKKDANCIWVLIIVGFLFLITIFT